MRCVSRIVHVPVVLYHGCGVRFVFFHVATAYTLSLYGLLLLVCLLGIYVASHAQIEGQIKEDFNANEPASIAISGSTFPVKQPRVRTSVILPRLGIPLLVEHLKPSQTLISTVMDSEHVHGSHSASHQHSHTTHEHDHDFAAANRAYFDEHAHEHSHGHDNAHGRERAIRQVNALRKAWPELFDEDSTIAMDYACGTGTYFP